MTALPLWFLKGRSLLPIDVKKGLFFRGAERLPFGAAIRPVRKLIEYLLGALDPAPV